MGVLWTQPVEQKTFHTRPLCIEPLPAIRIVFFDLSTSPDPKDLSSAAVDTTNEPFLCETSLEPALPA